MSHTLLLADDSETTHRVVTLMFAERGVRVVSAMNGQQAVERLSAEPPDIVLAAISLPKVDGFQLAGFMQGQPQLRNVPLLLLSGAFDSVDEERVRQSGASGVLVKPFESELVINRVKELLGFGGKSDRPVTPPGGRLFPQEAPPHRPSLTGPRGAGAPAPRPDFPPRQDPPPSTHARHEPPPNHTVPPAPNDASAPPSARTDAFQNHGGGEAPQQPVAWDQLREQSGLGPETAHVESGNAGGADDYFDRLDAAFDNLDAQLSGSSPSRPRDAASTTRRMPAQDDIPTRRLPPVHQDEQSHEGRRTDTESPYEDADWFNDQPSPPSAQPEPSAFARPEPAASYGGTSPPSYGVTPPPVVPPEAPPSYGEAPPANAVPAIRTVPVAPAAPAGPVYRAAPVAPVAPAPSFADAFDHLLAAEQGEAQPPAESQVQGPFIEISDEVIERIATRVAERLSEGVFVDALTDIVNAVSERLVREEIARIRSAAQGKKS